MTGSKVETCHIVPLCQLCAKKTGHAPGRPPTRPMHELNASKPEAGSILNLGLMRARKKDMLFFLILTCQSYTIALYSRRRLWRV